MNKDFLNTDLYKNCELKTYTSIAALSNASGIPRPLLKLAKKQNYDGFQLNQSVNFRILKPDLENNIDELLLMGSDDIQHYKKEIAKREVKLKDLQIKKLEKNMLEPEEVKNMFIELATKQSVVIKKIFGELPPRISGKSEQECKVILDKYLEQIFELFIK